MSVGAGVVDSWAILALLQGEGQASRTMQRLLRRVSAGNLRLYLNIVNLGEVYYRIYQLAGEVKAAALLALVRRLPIEVVQAREPLVMEAARLKARHRISHADAFAVATARMARAAIITGDPEILALPSEVVRVRALQR